jgi:hypothetical protein
MEKLTMKKNIAMNDYEFKFSLKKKLEKQIKDMKPKAKKDEFYAGLVTAYEDVIWLIDISQNHSKSSE